MAINIKRARIPRSNIIKNTVLEKARYTDISYKNIALLNQYTSEDGMIAARRLYGLPLKKHKLLVKAIKRARFLGLIPFGSSELK